MKKMQFDWKRIWKKKYLPLVIFAVIQLVYHILMREPEDSDALWFFQCQLDAYTLKDYLSIRYQTWSSRFLIESVLVYISRNMFLWKILDWGFWVFLAWAFTGLFPEEQKERAGYLIVGFLLIYPMCDLRTAGWIATSVNYTWPVACGVFSLHGTVRAVSGKKTSAGRIFLYVLAALFAANMEQMCAVILAVNALAVLYLLLKKTPFKILMPPLLGGLAAASEFVFIMTCPGNAARKEQEIINWMPNFQSLNLLDKISMAFVDTMHHLIASENLIYLCYLLILAWIVFEKTHHAGCRFAAVFPIAVHVAILDFPGMLETYFPSLWKVLEKNAYINGTNYHLASNYVPTLLYLVLIGCMLLALTAACESYEELFGQIFLLALGLATRLIMGFTPTIYVSQERTFFFLYMILMISAVFLLIKKMHMLEKNQKRFEGWKLAGMILAVFGILVNLSEIGV